MFWKSGTGTTTTVLVVDLWKIIRSAHLGFSIVAPIHADSIGFTDQLSTVVLYFWFLSVLSSFLSFLLGANPSNLAWVLKTAMLNSYWKMSFLCRDHIHVCINYYADLYYLFLLTESGWSPSNRHTSNQNPVWVPVWFMWGPHWKHQVLLQLTVLVLNWFKQ